MAGLGAMLPDLWRMADRRMRARPRLAGDAPDPVADELLKGVEHHLEVDAWFHDHPAFLDGERELTQRFRAAGVGATKMGLFAHIAWELCLDGALLRRVGAEEVLDGLRRSLEKTREPDPDGHGALDRVALRHRPELAAPGRLDTFRERLDGLFERLAWGNWIPGYAHGPGIAARLGGVRRRVGLGAFEERDRALLGELFEEALDGAENRLDELLDVRAPQSP